MASENYTSESKNLVLLPFSWDDEDLPTQPAVNETTTTTTINSRNNANTSNNTVNKTNGILITSSITTTATNNRTNNKNTNTNTVSDSNNFLTPTSETTNNKTNSATVVEHIDLYFCVSLKLERTGFKLMLTLILLCKNVTVSCIMFCKVI